jgi:hypothetical protein
MSLLRKFIKALAGVSITVATLYIALMLHYRTAIPADLAYCILNKTWTVDSVLIVKQPFHFSTEPHVLGCQADTGCEVEGVIYLRNNIHRVLRIDSVILHERSYNLSFRTNAHVEVSSGELLYRGTIVCKEPFRIFYQKTHRWTNGGMNVWSDPFIWRTLAEKAFDKHSFELVLYADRDSIVTVPIGYRTRLYGQFWLDSVPQWKERANPVTHGLPQYREGI